MKCLSISFKIFISIRTKFDMLEEQLMMNEKNKMRFPSQLNSVQLFDQSNCLFESINIQISNKKKRKEKNTIFPNFVAMEQEEVEMCEYWGKKMSSANCAHCTHHQRSFNEMKNFISTHRTPESFITQYKPPQGKQSESESESDSVFGHRPQKFTIIKYFD